MLYRLLAGLIGLFDFGNGLFMALRPEQWFRLAPGALATGPFNPHFVTDVGLGYVVAGLGLFVFALLPRWRLAAFGACGFVAFHGLFHLLPIAQGHAHNAGTDLAVALPALLGVALCWPTNAHNPERAMIGWLVRRILDRFARKWSYDVRYMRAMFEASPAAFRKFGAVSRLSGHRQAVPVAAAHTARLVGVMHEDCGPCTQLVADMASAAGMADDQIVAVLSADLSTMRDDVALGYTFARALVERRTDLADVREKVRHHWGDRGVIDLTFAAQMTRIYPMVKAGMGYAEACGIVSIGGASVVPLVVGARGQVRMQT